MAQTAPCGYVTQQEPPITLTVQVSGGGTTTPAVGTYSEPTNSVVVLNATANSGYYFTGWAGNVAVPKSASTTVTMDSAQAVAANFQLHDFVLGLNPDTLTIPVGGVASSGLTSYAFGDFADKVSFTASGQPTGVSVSFSANPVTPIPTTPASSIFKLTLGPSATPQTFTETVTGTSTGAAGTLTRSVPLSVSIIATAAAITNVINSYLSTGAIDKSGIANALNSKLSTAQTYISAADNQTAVNVLGAMLNQLNAQSGKHIAVSAANVLISDESALQISLGANLRPDPVMGSVTNSSNAGIAGATVSILNSSGAVVAAATTDSTGLYFFPLTKGWTSGAGYIVRVALPKGYKTLTPASQKFTWQATQVMLGNFMLN